MLTGSGMPGNHGFYSTNPKMAPNIVRLRFEEIKMQKVMIWAAISAREIGEIYISPEHQCMNSNIYQTECLPRVLDFIDKNYQVCEKIVFGMKLKFALKLPK